MQGFYNVECSVVVFSRQSQRNTSCGNCVYTCVGGKGGHVTLPCQHEPNNIHSISLNSQSEDIPVCESPECEGRVFKRRNCDIFIEDLIFSDAGKYYLNVSYLDDKEQLERLIRTFHLHIHDKIDGRIGEELKLEGLLSGADKVEHRSRTMGLKEVWTRTSGVLSDHLTVRDGNLIITAFTDSDAGTYRALDDEGNIWINVTISNAGHESNRYLNTDEETTDETTRSLLFVILPFVVITVLVSCCDIVKKRF